MDVIDIFQDYCYRYNILRIIVMNLRAKVKVILAMCGVLVCAYLVLPGRSGQTSTRHLDTGVHPSQNQPVHQAVILKNGIPQQGFPQQGLQGMNFQQDPRLNQGNSRQDGKPQGENSQNIAVVSKAETPKPISNIQPSADGDQPEISALIASQLGLHPDVKIVSSMLPNGAASVKIDCVPLPKSPRAGVSICVYPTIEDKWVSGSLRMNQLWEEDLVLAMQRALQADPSMMLLDLGSNLGLYALFAAAMGRSVLAVEMLPTNVMMIQKSLTLSKLSGKVLIVNNALYRDHRTLQTRFMSQNIGGSRLNTSKVYENIDNSRPAVSVRTICLDDLSPLLKGKTVYMKIDIENSEHHALACANTFFTEVNVKIVQIEWLHRTPEESRLISDFMSHHGYALSKSALSYSPLADSSRIAKADAYFLKKSAFSIS
ncbi:hypothetical protein ElyMa_000148900 [Elysia marginata]|uniref:Methyltransferase FkbM domain-containing protein n=1 Tax=Elysia marginata TaxID=1093978 RepID=A0AAV4EQS5_9GAST|nr:hypothetical protein ElyMa_000148900 [Elysia marginata]